MPPLNLFPLLLVRPLRLFLPSENVRRIRIFVLKTTHLPFVVLIWAYERSHRLVSRRVHTLPPPLAKPVIPTTRPFSSGQLSLDGLRDFANSPTSKSALNRSSLPAAIQRPETPSNSALTGSNNADLVALVQNLTTQVETLTAAVTGLQKQ